MTTGIVYVLRFTTSSFTLRGLELHPQHYGASTNRTNTVHTNTFAHSNTHARTARPLGAGRDCRCVEERRLGPVPSMIGRGEDVLSDARCPSPVLGEGVRAVDRKEAQRRPTRRGTGHWRDNVLKHLRHQWIREMGNQICEDHKYVSMKTFVRAYGRGGREEQVMR